MEYKVKNLLRVVFFGGGCLFQFFLVSSIYALPSTNCSSSNYQAYACDGNTRYRCVRSSSTTSSGTTYSYYWQFDQNCSNVCSAGSCVECTTSSYPQSCSIGVLYYCLANVKTSMTCTYGSCKDGTTCSPGCVYNSIRYSTGDAICQSGRPADCRPDGTWRLDNCISPKVCSGAGNCVDPNCDQRWPGSVCRDKDYCNDDKGNAADCLGSSNTCCLPENVLQDACTSDQDCVNVYGSCHRCNSAKPRACYSYTNSGTNGICGAANGSSACNWSGLGILCSSGNLSIGDSGGSGGTFNWNCNGIKASTCPASVTSVSCSATRKVVNTTCGESNQTCNDGTATNFRNETRSDGIYSLWDCNATCNGSNKTGCAYKTCNRVDGVCGTTAANTCNGGTATSTGSETRSDGIYALWRCDGECGGSNDTGCAYKTCSRVDGVCGTTAANTCNSGKVTNTRLETRSDGIYALWRCDGECSGTNSSSCSFRSAACGYARGGSSCLPPAAGLCAVGTASAVSTNTATNTFSWNCSGSTGAIDSCTSIRTVTNGECGSAKGGNFSSTPTVGLCNKGDPTEVTLSGTTYSWSCVSDCNGIADLCSAIYDVPPVPSVTPIPIPPTSTDPAPNPSGGQRLHNCQFNNPNLVTIKIGVTDPNGISDVAGVYLRFSGLSTEYGPVKPSAAGVVTFNIDITSMPDGVYTVQAKADDVHDNLTSGWVSLPYTFKKWDCLVNVSGTFYDGSDVPISCAADSGYSNPIPSELSFDFRYTIGTSSPRNMTVNSPNFNSDTNNRLYWTSPVDYQPLLINFPGTNPTQARVNGVCYNTSSLDAGIADPFAPNPSLSVQYSSIMDQEAWYLVGGGAIVAKGIVTNYIPATCTNNCRTTNDMILSAKTASLSPYDKAETENQVYDNKVLNLKPYSYDALKRQYLSTKGVGSTTLSDATWSQLPIKQGVIFVNGDLTIDTNIITTDLVMIIAKGTIIVNPTVTRVDGILMGNNISIGGQSANQLIINGSIYSLGDVTLNRSFEPKKLNNATPAIKIEYNPSLIFKLPAKMIQAISRWRLVQ